MNKLFWIPVLGLASAACQPQAASHATASKVGEKSATASVPSATGAAQPVATAATAPTLALLRQVDLTPAWMNRGDPSEKSTALEGFYGSNHYRISFFFSKVRRDSLRPEVFHVWGLNRYKKVITPFTGTYTVRRIAALPDTVQMFNSKVVQAYTAFADYILREDPTTKGTGVYSGKVMLDFCVNSRSQASVVRFDGVDMGLDNPTRGSGLLFEGTWQNNQTGQRKAASWASDFSVIVPETLQKIGLGQRGDTVYPELAKYGWNDWWENDEWWAESPKPSLSL
ncbi:hypothetical protein [Hymenobacter terrenus]|uniref:hypothetical protein n=1 Tax=Hymenobacter terrenus TaxID=1629124 RepID=UPI0006196EA9|nr:hypothetical protein [Hymenobacter terrenus]